MKIDNLKSTQMYDTCHSERAAAIEESCGSERFFACAQNDGGGVKRFFAFAQNDRGGTKRFFANAQNDRGNTKRFFASTQNDGDAQTGRSMLEMLGVLAIIGMLSVGAVMGFRQAMNRHKANVILNDVSLAFEELATHGTTGAINRYQVTAFTPESGHALYAKRDAEDNSSVEVQGVAKGVCEILIQYEKTELYAQISDTDGAKLTACADDQAMVFGLAAGSSTDPDPGPGPQPTDPCDGKTCSGRGTCSDGVCTCSDGYTDPNCGTPPECNMAIACDGNKTCVDYHCCPFVDMCESQAADCTCSDCTFPYYKKMAAAKDVRELKDPMQIKRLASAPKSKIVKHTMTTAAFAVFAKTDIVRLPTVNVKKSRLVEVTNKAVQAGQIIGVAQKL